MISILSIDADKSSNPVQAVRISIANHQLLLYSLTQNFVLTTGLATTSELDGLDQFLEMSLCFQSERRAVATPS